MYSFQNLKHVLFKDRVIQLKWCNMKRTLKWMRDNEGLLLNRKKCFPFHASFLFFVMSVGKEDHQTLTGGNLWFLYHFTDDYMLHRTAMSHGEQFLFFDSQFESKTEFIRWKQKDQRREKYAFLDVFLLTPRSVNSDEGNFMSRFVE